MFIMSELLPSPQVERSLSDAQLLAVTLIGNLTIQPQVEFNGVQSSMFCFAPDIKNRDELRTVIATVYNSSLYKIAILEAFKDNQEKAHTGQFIESVTIDTNTGETKYLSSEDQQAESSENDKIVSFINRNGFFPFLARLRE